MVEFSGLDEIIKLTSETPALDPFIVHDIPYRQVNHYVNVAIRTLEHRLEQKGFTDYQMLLISDPNLPLAFEGKNVKSIDEENVPQRTVYVLTAKIGNRSTIKPLDKISWQEFFIQIMLGNHPKLSISPMWAQARIRWK